MPRTARRGSVLNAIRNGKRVNNGTHRSNRLRTQGTQRRSYIVPASSSVAQQRGPVGSALKSTIRCIRGVCRVVSRSVRNVFTRKSNHENAAAAAANAAAEALARVSSLSIRSTPQQIRRAQAATMAASRAANQAESAAGTGLQQSLGTIHGLTLPGEAMGQTLADITRIDNAPSPELNAYMARLHAESNLQRQAEEMEKNRTKNLQRRLNALKRQ